MNRSNEKNDRFLTAERARTLPEPIRRYMEYTDVAGKRWIQRVRLKQTGRFRLSLEQPWMPVTAEQTFTTDPPGFVWKARFKLAGLPLMSARDSYQDGHGHMFGKMVGLFTIFDSRGDQLDQGTMMRYLGEMIWFPTAFLGENITWQGIDEHTAQVTLTDQGRSVSAHMTFDDEGRPTLFNGLRYREAKGEYSLDSWSVPMTEYGARAGLNIPTRGLVTWNLPSGDLPYYDWSIGEVEYDS